MHDERAGSAMWRPSISLASDVSCCAISLFWEARRMCLHLDQAASAEMSHDFGMRIFAFRMELDSNKQLTSSLQADAAALTLPDKHLVRDSPSAPGHV